MQSYRLAWTTSVHEIWKAEAKLRHDSCFARKVSEGQPPAHIDAHLLAHFVGQQPSQSTFSPHRIFPFSNSSSRSGAQSALQRRAQRSVLKVQRDSQVLAHPCSSQCVLLPSLHTRLAFSSADFRWSMRGRNISLTSSH